MACVDCGDEWTVARGRCDTCYRRARRAGVVEVVQLPVKPAEVERMRRLQVAGLSLNKIARVVGRGVTTVHRHLVGSA